MNVKTFSIAGFLVLAMMTGAGCKRKSEPGDSGAEPTQRSDKTSWLHWAGKKRLGGETNAAYFMSLWNLPESARLEEQTVAKFAAALERTVADGSGNTNAAARRLQPLIRDLVTEETFVEFLCPDASSGEIALAIRLDDARAAFWRSNLSAVLNPLAEVRKAAPGDTRHSWMLKTRSASEWNLVELDRAGEWTVLGLASRTNVLFGEQMARLKSEGAPRAARTTNYWLEADVDVNHLSRLLSLNPKSTQNLPRFSLTVTGDGENVRSHGELNFPKPLSFDIRPWQVPTNLISDPLTSFAAVRGLKPWLGSLQLTRDLKINPAPDQVFAWSQKIPFQTYVAALMPQAGKQVDRIADQLIEKVNPWLATNGMGQFQKHDDFVGAAWSGVPVAAPFIQLADSGDTGYALAGLLPLFGDTNPPPPAELMAQLFEQPDLVGYQWELTGVRIEAQLYVSQFLRLIFHKPQFPSDSASMKWLQALVPKLGNYVTVVTREKPDRLTFVSKSSAGFSASQLHLLADWLESPDFPSGLHTFRAPPPEALRPPE